MKQKVTNTHYKEDFKKSNSCLKCYWVTELSIRRDREFTTSLKIQLSYITLAADTTVYV